MVLKNCKICSIEYDGHFNSSCCSLECRKESKKLVNSKYNTKIKQIKQTIIDSDNLEDEQWVDLKGYEDVYKISNYGRVKSKIRKGGGGIMKPHLGKNGYYSVKLRKNPTSKPVGHCVHRLIGLHFIPNPDNLPVIDHIDRDRTNNNISNLRWATYKTNSLNSSSTINKKGLIFKTKDIKNGKLYEGFRVQYYVNEIRKSKRFKNEEEAKNYLKSIETAN